MTAVETHVLGAAQQKFLVPRAKLEHLSTECISAITQRIKDIYRSRVDWRQNIHFSMEEYMATGIAV